VLSPEAKRLSEFFSVAFWVFHSEF